MVTRKTTAADVATTYTQHIPVNLTGIRYTPDELKTLMEAIQIAPSWMSKRFIMQELCGWTEERVKLNVKLKHEEDQQSQIGNKTGAFR